MSQEKKKILENHNTYTNYETETEEIATSEHGKYKNIL